MHVMSALKCQVCNGFQTPNNFIKHQNIALIVDDSAAIGIANSEKIYSESIKGKKKEPANGLHNNFLN